jgi:mono/diheme cytochrome c family protein
MTVVPRFVRPSLRSHPWLAFLAVTGLALTLQACGGGAGGAAPAAPAPAPVVAGPPGAQVYQRSCARCHGVDRQGKNGDPAVTPDRLRSIGDQQLELNIRNGKGEMPAFGGLTQTQVDDLIAYLRAG